MRALCLALCCACSLGAETEIEEAVPPVTVEQLWRGEYDNGTVLTLDELIVTSPLARSGRHFFAQSPEGGLQSGLRVELNGALVGWPPPVGSPVSLRGKIWRYDDGPSLILSNPDNGALLGDPVSPVVSPWTDDPDAVYSLVGTDLTVTSAPDPAGQADTDIGVQLRQGFDLDTPGLGRSGYATGISLPEAGLALRTTDDWTGGFENDPPISLTLAEIADQADGAWVEVSGVQASPWSIDGRYTVLQDEIGRGLWIDTEGWINADTTEGDRLIWTGEVRSDQEGLRLRAWTMPTLDGQGVILSGTGTEVGDRTTLTVSGLNSPDLQGRRVSDQGWQLDGRFTDIGTLPETTTVTAIVRSAEILAVLP